MTTKPSTETSENHNEKLNQAISEAINHGSECSVSEENAIASQFYVVEILTTTTTEKAEAGDFELLLQNDHYTVGEIIRHKFARSKTGEIVSGPHDCPPMPNVLALGLWVKERGITKYLAWDG